MNRMSCGWLLLSLFALACSGATGERSGETAAELDECAEGQKSDCAVDGRPGSRSCEIGEQGFQWGACVERQPDQCKAGDVMHCFAEGSFLRNQFGDMTSACQQESSGRWAYNPQACATPLVLAFDGEAVEFTQAPGSFDVFGQHASIGTDWVSAKTPWLVLDRDGDGNIADGSELFGSMTLLPSGERAHDGFSALSALDADADGWITPRDPAFASLKLWSDRDQDRQSSGAELEPTSNAGIEAIELSYRNTPRCNPSGCEIERARFLFRDAGGATREGAVIDVHLRGF
jgi:hypothetical protein